MILGLVVVAPALLGAARAAELPPLPAPRPGPAISLEDAIRRADAANRSLAVLRADLEAAAARRRSAYAALLPSLYGSVDYALAAAEPLQPEGPRLQPFVSRRELAAGLEARLPVVGPRRWASLGVARLDQELEALGVEQARQVLLYGVAQTFYQAALLQRLQEVFGAQAEALGRHVEAARSRYRAGVGDLVDVKRAQAELVAVREEQLKAAVALEDSRDALALLLALPEPPLPDARPTEIEPPAASAAEPGAPSPARRWDLRLAQQGVALADQQLTVAWARLLPTLDGTVQVAAVVPALDPGLQDARSQWFVGAVLAVPLLDATLYTQLQTSQISLRQARLALQEREAAAGEALGRARRAVAEAEQLVATAQIKAGLADDALELSQAAYVNGTGSALTVIDARRSSQTAHVDLETRRFELELARLALCQATGTDILETL